MITDDYEHDIAASMDDLESIDIVTIPPPLSSVTAISTSKLARFQRLPEIDENSTITDVSPSSSDILYRVSTDALAASIGGDLRKTVLINNSANEILSNSSLSINANNQSDDPYDIINNDSANNNFINGKSADDDSLKNNKVSDDASTVKPTGARRKFIVTRMDSKILLRPEAENLRDLSANANAATISFPCSSYSNRTPLTSLFNSNASFEPHLDKRFFDTSLVRINANSTQSLNVSNASSQNNSVVIDNDIWERRQDADSKPLVVSFQRDKNLI